MALLLSCLFSILVRAGTKQNLNSYQQSISRIYSDKMPILTPQVVSYVSPPDGPSLSYVRSLSYDDVVASEVGRGKDPIRATTVDSHNLSKCGFRSRRGTFVESNHAMFSNYEIAACEVGFIIRYDLGRWSEN